MADPPAGAAQVRRATDLDLAFVEACTRAAYAKYVARLGRVPQPMTRDYRDAIAAGKVWLLEADEGPSGLLVLEPEPDQLLIYSIAVAPERQGTGLGRRLLGFAETEARRQGYARLRLYTNARMAENVEIYRRAGYRETHRTPKGDSEIVHMARDLET